ncbi:hypothetical protein K435DRAFT_369728 [Dendrothele bispora CBS 962.96]|uniref:Uncharacterized protein n=1 Tax=Dendrothele bispora (strain CBS 962.96) TaxID=1314807 RepID=A0A4S8LCA8_DENBC|nr:hypothetical protein K435DRAFT_369728 [Dendrothele bispora CBS 962.96]
MSGAIRSKRSSVRNLSSPYAGGRPASKKSAWSTSSLLSLFNPFTYLHLGSTRNDDDLDEDELNSNGNAESAAKALNVRGQQISASIRSRSDLVQQHLPSHTSPPLPPPPRSVTSQVSSQPSQSSTAALDSAAEPSSLKNGLDIVTQYLENHSGQELTPQDAEKLIDILKNEQRETFRFSSSTPSTPHRGNSPLFPSSTGSSAQFQFTLPTSTSSNNSVNPSPSKFLKTNPNGRYRWEGGGSAKPSRSRNRFQSPAFGPSRAASERLVLRDSPEKEPTKTDTKRRRVGEEATSSTASPSGINGTTSTSSQPSAQSKPIFPFPVSNMNGSASPSKATSGEAPKLNGVSHSSTPRLRTSMLNAKPTTPAVPSPLRQTWGQSGSPPSRSDTEDGQTQQRQTKAANFMSELIKEVTPVKRLEVSNPYQAASPVPASSVPKSRPKRTRAAGKPTAPAKEVNGVKAKDDEKEKGKLEKEYSAQAIIEATVPKGSKRSRPPAQSVAINGSSTIQKSSPPPRVQIEEVEDEEDAQRVNKKAKSNGAINGISKPSPSKFAPTVIEITDEDELMADKPATTPSQIIEPKEQPLSSTSTSTSTSSHFGMPAPSAASPSRSIFSNIKASAPKEPSKLRFSYQPESSPSSSASPTPSLAASSEFLAPKPPAPILATPSSSITLPPASMSSPKIKDPKKAAASLPSVELPLYTFTLPPVASGSGSSSSAMEKARAAANAVPASSLPHFDFSKPVKPAMPVPASTVAAPVTNGFDWGAAGMKRPATSTGANWTYM